jgi:acetylxylan esterase
MRSAVLLVGLLASIASSLPEIGRRQSACADVHILVARASGEPKGEGMIGGLSTAIKKAVKGADSEAVSYAAALAPYGKSEIKGVANAKSQLTAYVKRCPKAKIVLMGYSQVRIAERLLRR